MFGQNNNDDSQNQPAQDNGAIGSAPVNSTPPPDFFNPAAQAPADQTTAPAPDTSAPDLPDSGGFPLADPNPTDFTAPSTPADGPNDDVMDELASEQPAAPEAGAPVSAPSNDQLLSMKQAALQQLNPLVGHLDQSPEEKFRTVMMMIQATDDHTKLSEAFDLAKQITDDKTRAQALLDVINEINYFTQNHGS
jgi:hypothetical protein